jgi:hypothetical protein
MTDFVGGEDKGQQDSLIVADQGAHPEQHLDILKQHHLEQKQEKLKQKEESQEKSAEDLLDLDL